MLRFIIEMEVSGSSHIDENSDDIQSYNDKSSNRVSRPCSQPGGSNLNLGQFSCDSSSRSQNRQNNNYQSSSSRDHYSPERNVEGNWSNRLYRRSPSYSMLSNYRYPFCNCREYSPQRNWHESRNYRSYSNKRISYKVSILTVVNTTTTETDHNPITEITLHILALNMA